MEEGLARAIERGVERGLVRCKVCDDDIGWMSTAILGCVLDEVKREKAASSGPNTRPNDTTPGGGTQGGAL